MDQSNTTATIATTPVSINHIGIDDRGTARIVGHRIRVIDIVWDTRGGMTPEMIHDAYPSLKLAEIHAALAYYYDHRDELDSIMERQLKEADETRAHQMKNPPPFLARILRENPGK